jgi:5'-nucleotidase (lipoprotein e(P4) family)
MTKTNVVRIQSTCLVLLLLTSACARRDPPRVTPAATPSPNVVTPRDTHERLHGVLWMQTGAEFWALSATAYREAQELLEIAIKDKTSTAALEQTPGFESLPAAVILDLDETVLDNSRFQAQLVVDRTDYLPPTWDAWVDKMDAGVVPGAREFITYAGTKGVKVFFITNRTAAEQEDTLKNLAALKIDATDASVLCTGENNWTSDKTARRAEVAKSHRVLLLIGDDLNDFVSTAKMTPEQRLALAMSHSPRWGRTWVLIPNPIYGSWERSLYPGLTKDEEILQKKRNTVKGFR